MKITPILLLIFFCLGLIHAADEWNISYRASANKNVVSTFSRVTLQGIMKQSLNRNIVVTSTMRTPEKQAAVMYDNIINKGVDYNLTLYKSAGDKVIGAMVHGKKNGLSKQLILQNMTALINSLGPKNISRHCGDFSRINVIDISPASVAKKKAFISAVRQRNMVCLTPPTDPAFHLEILQPSNNK